jgi:hypothetical protein
MIVTFGLQTLGATAQPLFADKITAALAIPPVGIDPIVTVANTAIYQTGFRLLIDAGQAAQDVLRVGTILTSTTMSCSYESAQPHAHAVNAVIALAIGACEIVVQPIDGGTGDVILGTDNTVTALMAGSAFCKINKTASGTMSQGYRMTNTVDHNVVRTDDVWIVGTTGDKYLASAVVL